MKEMLIVGRGGEGVVLASQILAETFARAGLWVQSFPEFKAERRGAPISAFLRWDESSPIHRRYKMRSCDVLVDLSPGQPAAQALHAVRPGGLVVLNRDTRFPHAGPFRIARVPAGRIAREHGILSAEGRPMGNTAVLGGCVRLLLPSGLAFLEQAVAARMGALAAANIAAAGEGYARCITQHALAGDAPIPPLDVLPDPGPRPVFAVTTTDTLANHTGTWSTERPQPSELCTACGVCALFCPEGAITRVGDTMVFDYLYCKGCGICEVVCPVRNALTLSEVAA
jgi:2-oxoacid:acceptor oxidoreductase gamma subunit (pyruvate/2-ketoisovalerate family)/2-oxoacid:acceptor oxidoreductase delta subunit (pyruvate/2-ketoisovalerate family)